MRDDTSHESHNAGGNENWRTMWRIFLLYGGAAAFTIPSVIISLIAAWRW